MGEKPSAAMEVPEIARHARNFSVMVRIQGPDPKRLKMRHHAFHLHRSGITTLSASGLLLPPNCPSEPSPIMDHIRSIHKHAGAMVVTSASLMEPFLSAELRGSPTSVAFFPKLIPGAQIDVLVEDTGRGSDAVEPNTIRPLPSRLLALVEISASSVALKSLFGTHNGSWEVGWALVPLNNNHLCGASTLRRQVESDVRPLVESHMDYVSDNMNDHSGMVLSATRIAFLAVSTAVLQNPLHLGVSQHQQKGDPLLALGSPFGALSPSHFINSISVGTVANSCPPRFPQSSLLMADIRCLPGTEGAPVFDRHACLIGVLMRPLRQKGSGAEIQLVITWNAVAAVWANRIQKEERNKEKTDMNLDGVRTSACSSDSCRSVLNFHDRHAFPCPFQPLLEKAVSSIALVKVDDRAWASGIILNSHGLILTNAHILEPWRFARTYVLDHVNKSTLEPPKQASLLSKEEGNAVELEKQTYPLWHSEDSNASGSYGNEPSFSLTHFKTYRKISVRLDYMEPKIWSEARAVYVSKGPLDVALLQLESVPNQIPFVTPDFSFPTTGVPIHVVGHGLLGPRSDISPSVSSGVLTKVVEIPGYLYQYGSSFIKPQGRNMPVMLQTTASVHPGASGGAVINSQGHLIGLVTSNAKHGSGTLIPHLNFSLPCAAMERIFEYSDKHEISLLKVLDEPNELFSAIWALAPLKPQNTSKKHEVRGSRFSKFLAERQAERIQSDQNVIVEKKLCGHLLHPSKM